MWLYVIWLCPYITSSFQRQRYFRESKEYDSALKKISKRALKLFERRLENLCWRAIAGQRATLMWEIWVPVASGGSAFKSHLIPVYLKYHVWLESGPQSHSEGCSAEGPLNMLVYERVSKTRWHSDILRRRCLGKDVWLCTLEEKYHFTVVPWIRCGTMHIFSSSL